MTLTSLIRNLESQLKKAEKLTRHYDSHASALRRKLESVAGIVGENLGLTKATRKTSGRKKRKMSRAGRASIAAAQRKRWAAHHAKQGVKKATVGKKRRTISKAHKKAIAAAQKARWAKWREGKKGK